MDDRITLRNISGKNPPIVLGCHEIWAVDFEGQEIGKISGSPVCGINQEPDGSGRWNWIPMAYWGEKRPVEAWARVKIGGSTFATKEGAAERVLDYQLTCRAANWSPDCWKRALLEREQSEPI